MFQAPGVKKQRKFTFFFKHKRRNWPALRGLRTQFRSLPSGPRLFPEPLACIAGDSEPGAPTADSHARTLTPRLAQLETVHFLNVKMQASERGT